MTLNDAPTAAQFAKDTTPGSEWWRSAVIYQVYPRSFADGTGDGIGDLAGVTAHIPDLADLGIDAIWLSPFYPSPLNDAGYDVADYCDVDPVFGTLDEFDRMLEAAHERGIRIIVDIVPNHSSSEHAWFKAAVAAGPGSPERARYLFREGKGEHGELPPNNWQSLFGGPAWTRLTEADGTAGQWYLHLFDSTQPDFDWSNPVVHQDFEDILRFWLDRGVDGFRIDVAHGLAKEDGLPDYIPVESNLPIVGDPRTPYLGQEAVHDIFRAWHLVAAEYDGDRVLCGEAWLPSVEEMAEWVRPGQLHQTFNFAYLRAPWDADGQKEVVTRSLAAFAASGAPSTWVLSNHDTVRHATRLALTEPNAHGAGVGPKTPGQPDPIVGERRARAATALMLGLPGSSYLYQGEELGLPDVIDLADDARQDPIFIRSEGELYGRDGCRVPIPWEAEGDSYGFSPTGESWLPQPELWAKLARSEQVHDPASTLNLYRSLLALRREHDLGLGDARFEWVDGFGDEVLAYRNGDVTVITNFGVEPVALPEGRRVLARSEVAHVDAAGELATDTTVWLAAAE
ncbi:glycoside hydrolase family 13 protein [Pseudoclavibacter terrae]|uniref:glycoside hydrolase family 13 protein n=1 Tax=Pseudoclavibacter terrae TaxID=1530195 RepID=UPI0023303364|nr:glycoside hydrolase family 13 protein [Pseudoclavibacter terrae]